MLAGVAYALTPSVGKIELIDKVNEYILNPLVALLFAIALVYFVWGMVEFIGGQENEEKLSSGKKHMIYGVIGFFVMVSVFGIIRLIIGFLSGLQ